jgi:hypothetical protein
MLGFRSKFVYFNKYFSAFSQVGKAISNAMNNDYVVGAYYTGHWVIVIICMKFKEV